MSKRIASSSPGTGHSKKGFTFASKTESHLERISGARNRSPAKRAGGGTAGVPFELRKEFSVIHKFYSDPNNAQHEPSPTIASYLQRLLPFISSIERAAIMAKPPATTAELHAAEDRLISQASVWALRRNDPIFDDIKPNQF